MCSMNNDDQTEGVCGSVLGTKYYEKAVEALRIVKEHSGCHTLDRHDFRA